jgi:uncharacterized protein
VPYELDPVEVRVLGALVEKDMTTPEYYPLSVNALTNACNQKTNRDPVVSYDEQTVSEALERLRARRMASTITGREVRVPKHAHRISETLNLGNRELAVLCVLLLRGPQTVGELRERAGRIYRFDDDEGVEACLRRLAQLEPDPLAIKLDRRPGEREARYAHLLSGLSVDSGQSAAEETPARGPSIADRVTALESEVAELKRLLNEFRRQFE